uniref:Uncharacterized protein n=1 Tax=Rhizophora mucronata TaxID=61149 RepID=A0A2P2MAB3_RHIMU
MKTSWFAWMRCINVAFSWFIQMVLLLLSFGILITFREIYLVYVTSAATRILSIIILICYHILHSSLVVLDPRPSCLDSNLNYR